MSPNLITCQCQHCGGEYNFASAEFHETSRDDIHIYGQTVECPHCQRATITHRPRPVLKPILTAANQRRPAPHLTTCPDCGREISQAASNCPGCGRQFRNPGAVNLGDPVHLLGLGLCLLIMLGVLWLIAWGVQQY